MGRQVDGQKGKPGEDVLLSFASDTDAFYGRLDQRPRKIAASHRSRPVAEKRKKRQRNGR